jgi:hypothetical protein
LGACTQDFFNTLRGYLLQLYQRIDAARIATRRSVMGIRRLMYWVIAGGLIGFGFIGILSIGLPFLIVGVGMLVVGAIRWHGRGFWLAVIAFGALPTLILAFDLLTAPPPCPGTPVIIQSSQGYVCGGHYEGYYALAAIFGGIALLGIAWPLARWLWSRQRAR